MLFKKNKTLLELTIHTLRPHPLDTQDVRNVAHVDYDDTNLCLYSQHPTSSICSRGRKWTEGPTMSQYLLSVLKRFYPCIAARTLFVHALRPSPKFTVVDERGLVCRMSLWELSGACVVVLVPCLFCLMFLSLSVWLEDNKFCIS